MGLPRTQKQRPPVARERAGQLPQVGVEEEFLLVDVESGRPAPRISSIIEDAETLAGKKAQQELHQAQIEIASPPCRRLEDLAAELTNLRSKVANAARAHDTHVVALGSFPSEMGVAGELITAEDRYRDMARANAALARQQLICGCHVHVSIDGPDHAISIMNRVRRWLPTLLALSANSPFWEGQDTGFASYRTEVWTRWPTSGPPGQFSDIGQYEDLIDRLVKTEVILDRGMAYWDVRPSDNYPTLEFRVCDVVLSVEDAVALAGLIRGLVVQHSSEAGPITELRHELLRAASWRAARSGLSGDLIDPLDGSTKPARQAVEDLVNFVTPALDRLGETSAVQQSVLRILEEGNGADRQRRALEVSHDVADVIKLATIHPDQ
jgi:carboxylate-amine ligase